MEHIIMYILETMQRFSVVLCNFEGSVIPNRNKQKSGNNNFRRIASNWFAVPCKVDLCETILQKHHNSVNMKYNAYLQLSYLTTSKDINKHR